MFEKNLDFLSEKMAEDIRNTKAAVIGTGALGQMTAHELVRLGFEQIVLMDDDLMEYSNFNRQLYAVHSTLGEYKANILAENLKDIKPDLRVDVHLKRLDDSGCLKYLEGCEILIDCVDHIPTKCYMEELAEQMNIPMIHGAVDGWFGQVTTIYPKDKVMKRLYPTWITQERTALMPTVSIISSIQAAEAVKIAAGFDTENLLRHKVMFVDLLSNDFSYIKLD